MDVNLRKTATDTAYVVVGVGVLGFQQAQVKRRDAVARVSAIRRDARSSLTAADRLDQGRSGRVHREPRRPRHHRGRHRRQPRLHRGRHRSATRRLALGRADRHGRRGRASSGDARAVSTQVKAGADAARSPTRESGSTRSSVTSGSASSRSSSSCARSRCPTSPCVRASPTRSPRRSRSAGPACRAVRGTADRGPEAPSTATPEPEHDPGRGVPPPRPVPREGPLLGGDLLVVHGLGSRHAGSAGRWSRSGPLPPRPRPRRPARRR